MKKRTLVLAIGLTVVFCVIFAAITIILISNRHVPEQKVLTGMVENAEIDIAAKIPGRIGAIYCSEGAAVRKGDTLVVMESRELDAKAGQAQAALQAALAKQSMANNGLRPQEKDAAEKLFQQAKTQADLMEKTWNRVRRLANDSIVSSQERDQVEAQYLAAKDAMDAAEARLSMAREGSRAEDRSAAAALVAQAQQVYAEATAWCDEKVVTCPINGEVGKQIMRSGEIVGAGAPILTVVDLNDAWIIVTVKEDSLSRFRMGSVFNARIPALGDTVVTLAVSFIAPMGDFATWRPTNQRGGFDLKTFEVHLRPQSRINGLRAGMSVNIIL